MPSAVHAALAGGGPRHLALHPTAPVAYVAYELTSVVAAFAIDATSGAIRADEPPLGLWSVLEGFGSPFLHGPLRASQCGHLLLPNPGAAAAASLPLKPGQGASICSDKATSIAAVRIAPDGSHLAVSSRLVGAPGALTTISLTPSGMLITDRADMPVRITRTLGRTPRDFLLLPPREAADDSGRRRPKRQRGGGGSDARPADLHESLAALVASQDDDTIGVLTYGQECVELTKAVPTPVCLCLV